MATSECSSPQLSSEDGASQTKKYVKQKADLASLLAGGNDDESSEGEEEECFSPSHHTRQRQHSAIMDDDDWTMHGSCDKENEANASACENRDETDVSTMERLVNMTRPDLKEEELDKETDRAKGDESNELEIGDGTHQHITELTQSISSLAVIVSHELAYQQRQLQQAHRRSEQLEKMLTMEQRRRHILEGLLRMDTRLSELSAAAREEEMLLVPPSPPRNVECKSKKIFPATDSRLIELEKVLSELEDDRQYST